MPLTPRIKRSCQIGIAALACFAVLAVASIAAMPNAPAAEPAHIPNGLVVASPRVCAALAVYELAATDDFGLRATVASTALNAFRDAGRLPDCSPGVAHAVSAGFEPQRWQASLDAVDAVTSGSFMISPDACVRANAVVPLSTADGDEPANSPVVARTQCVISNLAFVEVAP